MANPHPSSKGRPFKPGQSGNPGGRAKAKVDLLAVLDGILSDREKSIELMAALVEAGVGGDVRAIALILDRVHGPVVPVRPVEIDLVAVALEVRRRTEAKSDD